MEGQGAPTLDRAPGSRAAWVTLVTNPEYARGAAVLARSIRLTGSPADIVVLATGGVDDAALAPIAAHDVRIARCELLPTSPAFVAAHGRDRLHAAAPFTKGGKPAFHTPLDNFVKLRLWQLPYARAVFVDADALMLRPCDRLFDYPELCAAPNVYESLADFGRMNSGVFTARPDPATFARLLTRLDAPGAFWRRTDQTFLETAFPEWHGLPVYMNLLQYVWFNLPGLWDWKQVRIVHYQYEKPWNDHGKLDRLGPLVALWRAYASGGPVPDPSSLPDPCTS